MTGPATAPPRTHHWVDDALCRDADDPDMWFPHPGDLLGNRLAKQWCDTCPVRTPCAAWAMAHPSEQGVWGGMSERERDRARRRR